MKKILLVSISLIFFQIAKSQQIMVLKNGNKMNGKIEKVNGDTISFKFQGNRLKIASVEIKAIYFDESSIQDEQIKEKTAGGENGKLTGVITYFFNDNYGDKPDVGAIVYILDSISAVNFVTKDSVKTPINVNLIENYLYGAFYLKISKSYGKDVPANVSEQIRGYGVETEEKYTQLGDSALTYYSRFRFKADKVTVDGNGSYSKSIKPGTYYVLIQSKHRESLNSIEVVGNIYLKTIHITSGEEFNLSHNFPVN